MATATRALATACTAFAVALLVAAPAVAHSDQGTMTAEARRGADSLSVTARARVVFANDGHPANEAKVTVAGTGPGGAQVGPITLNRVDEGEYEGVVAPAAPGEWALVFNSTNPASSAGTTFTVTTGTVGTPPSTAVRRASASDGNSDNNSGLNPAVIAAGGAVVVAALVGGLLVVRRRH